VGAGGAGWGCAHAASAAQASAAVKKRIFMERSSLGFIVFGLDGRYGDTRRNPVHAQFTRSRSVSGSSGQRSRGAKSNPSTRFRERRSIPAQAIIAALSVQSRGGGATKR
jgi:hypothetical protein